MRLGYCYEQNNGPEKSCSLRRGERAKTLIVTKLVKEFSGYYRTHN
jgi:hypothetical protein